MEQGAEALTAIGIEGGLRGMRARGFGLKRGEALLVKGVDGVAHGLVIAAQGASNGSGMLALVTRQEHLAAADSEASRRAQSALEGCALGRSQRVNK